jgi:hypothetical protein
VRILKFENEGIAAVSMRRRKCYTAIRLKFAIGHGYILKKMW